MDAEWFAERRQIDEVRLGPLDDAAILKIAMDRLQLPQLSRELGDHLRGRARGNPHYLLETIRSLSEKGLGGGNATNRQDLTNNQPAYSAVIARPTVLGASNRNAMDKARAAVFPQIKGFADDIRRVTAYIRPAIHKFLDAMSNGFKVAKKVKKDYDPKTVDSLRDNDPQSRQ